VLGRDIWRVVVVYNREGKRECLEEIRKLVGEREEENLLVLGDIFQCYDRKRGRFWKRGGGRESSDM